jgi:predicted nucleic acid-binding Zn ribbon protein
MSRYSETSKAWKAKNKAKIAERAREKYASNICGYRDRYIAYYYNNREKISAKNKSDYADRVAAVDAISALFGHPIYEHAAVENNREPARFNPPGSARRCVVCDDDIPLSAHGHKKICSAKCRRERENARERKRYEVQRERGATSSTYYSRNREKRLECAKERYTRGVVAIAALRDAGVL